LRRYDAADRALFPEVKQLMKEGHSLTHATFYLATDGRVAGGSKPESKARRVAMLFQKEKAKK
jgi:hypothetical protein